VGIKAIELQSRSVTNPNNSSFCDSYATLASGTPTDGIWSITCTVPSVVVPGDYIVTPYVEDMVGDWVNSNGGPLSPTRGYFSVAS
jgi:hypothetical protein